MKKNRVLATWLTATAASVALLAGSSPAHAEGNEKLKELLYCMQSGDAVKQAVMAKLKSEGCLKGAYQSQATATVCSEAAVYKDLEGKKDPTLAGILPQPDLACYTCEKDDANAINCSIGAAITVNFTLHLGAGYGFASGKLDVKMSMAASLEWSDKAGTVAKVKEDKSGTGSDRDMNIVAGVIRPKFTYKDGTVMTAAIDGSWPTGSVQISAGYSKTCSYELSIDTWIVPMHIGKKNCGDAPPTPAPILTDPPPCPTPVTTTPGTTPAPGGTTTPGTTPAPGGTTTPGTGTTKSGTTP